MASPTSRVLAAPSASSPILPEVEPVSVVLVEDNETYAALVGHVLRAAFPGGASVRVHGTLAGAISDLRDEPADCVVLDLSLPDADGLEALAMLHATGVDAPIVVLSALEDDEAELSAIEAGAQEFLCKGAERDVEAFGRTVRHAVARGRAQQRGQDLLRAKEDRWRTVAHLAPVGILETGADGRCVFANDRLCEMAARPAAALLGHGWLEAMHPEDRRLFDAAWRKAVDGDGEFSVELRFLRPGGETLWVIGTGAVVRDPWGGPAGWIGTMVDVSEARRAQEELRRQQEDVLAVAQLARDAGAQEDACPSLCAGARRLLGADFAALLVDDGMGALRVVAQDGAVVPVGTTVPLDSDLSASVRAFRTRERVEIEDAGAGEGVITALAGTAGARGIVLEPVVRGTEALGVLAIGWHRVVGRLGARHATATRLLAAEVGAAIERQRLLGQLRALARTDALTGLANRRAWDDRLAIEVARASRHGRPLCVAMLDLDRFKTYNDLHGHQAGDRLLRETTAAWQGTLRGSDLLARLGGDEFGLLLSDCDARGARAIVERLQRVTPPDAGCSAGVAVLAGGESPAALVARADAALYAVKAGGRGGIAIG